MKKIILQALICLTTLVGFIYFIGSFTDYANNIVTHKKLNFMATLNIIFLILELFYALIFLWLAYSLFRVFMSEIYFFWEIYSFSAIFLLILLALSLVFVIPGIFYFNSLILISHTYTIHSGDIQAFVPEITFNDFLKVCMDNKDGVSKIFEKEKIPPFNDHLMVAGTTADGNKYACMDILSMLNRSIDSSVGRSGAKLSKWALSIPDVCCFLNDDIEKPISSFLISPKK